jgi:hypothetical protein
MIRNSLKLKNKTKPISELIFLSCLMMGSIGCIGMFFPLSINISEEMGYNNDSISYPISATGENNWTRMINHTSNDLAKIPMFYINRLKQSWNIHYAHTSHGSQLMTGIELIENDNASLDQEVSYEEMPLSTGTLGILDGQNESQVSGAYITPEYYWLEQTGRDYTEYVLDNFPVNVSMWAWCTQLEYYSEEEVNWYLGNMTEFENAFPDVTFVYFTGNAQAIGSSGQTRHHNNDLIRNYCLENNKWCFDFEDLDSFYGTEQQVYTEGDESIPREHAHYWGDEAGHTTYESCENKGAALWWLLATIAGWDSEHARSDMADDTEKEGDGDVPGYDLFVLFAVSIAAIAIIKKKIKQN